MFNIFKKKNKNEKPFNNSPELLLVKLFFIDEPIINDEGINKSLKKRFKNVDFPALDPAKNKSRQYFFRDYETEFKEGKIAAQG